MLDSDRMIKLMIRVVLGNDHGELTLEERQFVDRVRAEIDEARRENPDLVVEIPHEIPDVSEPDSSR